MPMELKGSCQCGLVQFTVSSHTPVPYQLCACSICRKVGGYGGSVNLGALANTLAVTQGEKQIKRYKAVCDRGAAEERVVGSQRSFCGTCSAMLWVFDPAWPELIHPFATAIDSPPLPEPEEMVCIKANSKPDWVRWPQGRKKVYQDYGPESIENWHKKHGKYVD
ncbi:MAG: hypothetical protein M1825_003542 [Sarcosagium campestre]|nr:MAG: hypothetical protein M1825_003542 [Sarcosagium campestre]